MQISSTSNITFKYTHPIKTLWRKGLLPSVKYGLYGGRLTQENLSLEHLLCKTDGGKTFYTNVALATKRNNNIRGCKPLFRFVTPEQVLTYLEQFKGIKLPEFNGDRYIRGILHTLKELAVI